MKKILFFATALFLMSSCAQNEALEGGIDSSNDSKVRFAASTNKITKSEPINNTGDLQNKVQSFNVNGYVAGDADVLVSSQVDWTGTSWEYANEPYWPDHAMDFYAYANWGTAPVLATDGITAVDVEINEDTAVDAQKDMLVAMALGQTKSVRTQLTFKHALTQLVFKAVNVDDAGLEVRIGGLRIVNVASTGSMAYTKLDPAIKWTAAAQDQNFHLSDLQVTEEVAFTTGGQAATLPFQVPNTPSVIALNLTNTNNALMLVPQAFAAWDPTTALANTYIELLAIINKKYEMSNNDRAGATKFYYCGTPVLGAAGREDIYGKIYIPVSSIIGDITEWTPGKRINYTITFGDKESGSGGGGFDQDGNPILVPIRFKAEVDAWTNVEIPLLSATLEATSAIVDSKFVNDYISLLLADMATAKESKIFRASLTIKGKMASDAVLTFAPTTAQETVIAQNSVVTFDFSNGLDFDGKSIKYTPVTGWEAAVIVKGETPVYGATEVTANGTENQILVRKK